MKLKRHLLGRLMRVSVILAVVIAGLGLGASSASANGVKSLYVISNINAPTNIPIQAYSIQGTGLVYQSTGTIPDRDGGAVGIAIDTASEYLFVTFEFSGVLDIVDATTINRVGQVTAPGASNLAGIVVDEGKQKVYTVDRGTNHLYSYLWDPLGPTLTLEGGSYITLDCNAGLYGVALDEGNDLLYVGDSTATVKAYDTATWTRVNQFTQTNLARGIAIDEANQCVYSCGGGPGGGSNLTKFAMGSSTETVVNVGSTTLGVAVDQASGLAYITTYGSGTRPDRLLVYDGPNLVPSSTPTWDSGIIGQPTGLCIPRGAVSYNPLSLIKDDGLGGACVNPGANITYDISYDNTGNNNPVTDVVIEDPLPAEVNYVSCTGGGVYNGGTHTVTWDIGSLAAGAPTQSVTLEVEVDPATPGGTIISNTCSIDSNETGQAWATMDTPVCSNGPPPPQVPGMTGWGIIATAIVLAILMPLTFRRKIFGNR